MHRTIRPEVPGGEDASGVVDAAGMARLLRNPSRAEQQLNPVKVDSTRQARPEGIMQDVPPDTRRIRNAPVVHADHARIVRHA